MTGALSSRPPLQLLALLPVQRQGEWLEACLLCGGGADIEITQVASPHEAAAMLRQYSFDLLLFWMEGAGEPVRKAWAMLAPLTGHDGFVALGMQVPEGWHAPLFHAGALACLDMDATDPLTLVQTLRNCGELVHLREASREWAAEKNKIQQRETREVDRLLAGQRSLLNRLDELGGSPNTLAEESTTTVNSGSVSSSGVSSGAADQRHRPEPLSTPLGQQYSLALQGFLFDESQAAGASLVHLAELVMASGASSGSIMRIHLAAVTQMTSGAGAGTLRHCLTGADRFLTELLMRIIDGRQESRTPTAQSHVRVHARVSPLAAA